MRNTKDKVMAGEIAIMVTARDEKENVDEGRVRSHARFLKENGVTGENGAIVATGSIGECAALSPEERKTVWEAAVEATEGDTPIIAGINHTDPDQVIELGSVANQVGADGVMIMTPFYWAPSRRSVLDFFNKIIPELDLPVLIYNNIPATQMDLPLEIIEELAEYDNVRAIKECTPNFIKFERVFNSVSDKINVINGNAEFWEPYASLRGASGFVSGLVNFAPDKTTGILKATRKGNYQKVFEIKNSLQPYFDFFFEITDKYGMSVEPDILKVATSMVGSEVGPSKPPVTKLDTDEKEQLREALAESGVISI